MSQQYFMNMQISLRKIVTELQKRVHDSHSILQVQKVNHF